MLKINPEKLVLQRADLLRLEKELNDIDEELQTVLHRQDAADSKHLLRLKRCEKEILEYRRAMYELMILTDEIMTNSEKCRAEQFDLLNCVEKKKRRGDWVPIRFSDEELPVVDMIQLKKSEGK